MTVSRPAAAPAASRGAARPSASPQPAPTVPVPLQERSRAALRDGLDVKVCVGSDRKADPLRDLAHLQVGRLVQDAATFLADKAGVKPSLAKVVLDDRDADEMQAVGFAWFPTGKDKGQFHLSPITTTDLVAGVRQLRREPMEQWSVTERTNFAESIATVLHEVEHITLPDYTPATVRSAIANSQMSSFEEASSELASMWRMGDFFKHEFGQEYPDLTSRIQQATQAYSARTKRMAGLLDMAGLDGERRTDAVQRLGDAVPPKQRYAELARLVTDGLAPGAKVPEKLQAELTKTIPRFLGERPHGRTRMQTVLQAVADVGAGHDVDMDAVLDRLREMDRMAGYKRLP